MRIERAGEAHLDRWAALRAMLWPDGSVVEHRQDAAGWLTAPDRIAFVALVGGATVGFAEASIRRDHVNGCDTSPVAFLEGIAVDPVHRRRGIGRALTAAVEAWGSSYGCTELGSDTDDDNPEGQALHLSLGFEERERVVCYRKLL